MTRWATSRLTMLQAVGLFDHLVRAGSSSGGGSGPIRCAALVLRVVVFLEVLDGPLKLNPVVFRLLKNRYDRGWVFWICHRADCNTDHRRQVSDFPIDC